MSIDWKKYSLIAADILLGGYLLMAVTAFNTPDDEGMTCQRVDINVEDGAVRGFLDAKAVKNQLQRAGLYPEGDVMSQISVRRIEDALRKNPLVASAECYKTSTGRIEIVISQRLPVIRVLANNGDDYYIDSEGNIMPSTQYASNLLVATGNISKSYAKKMLTPIGKLVLDSPFWNSQIEQVNVLADGSVEMVPRVGNHVIYLGKPAGVSRKLERLKKFYRYGLSHAGWNKYKYISLEFDNQIICRKR